MNRETLGYALAGVESCAGRASNRQPSRWLTFKRLDSRAIHQDNNWVRFTFYSVSHRAEL